MSAKGSSLSTVHNLTDPSCPHEARLGKSDSGSMVWAFGWKAMQPTWVGWPRRVWINRQSGTDHNLHSPDHEAVANIFESGLKEHHEMGRVSASCEAWTSNCLIFRWTSCTLAILTDSDCNDSVFCRAIRSVAFGSEYSAINLFKEKV